jgi:tRNA(Ile)-lysidine synthase
VHPLVELLLGHIKRDELMQAGDRIGIAVSGGIDSVALLRLLLELRSELGVVLSVVHFNHKLRGAESDADENFVEALAREHSLEFHAASGDATQLAAEEHSGLEAAARELRYGFFQQLLEGTSSDDLTHAQLDKIATGHTLDDQAETVLMRLIRGTGLRGLGGIHPRILVDDENGDAHGEIIRPLLGIRRRELEQYLIEIKQPWREDSSNTDSKFTRNRVRHVVMPILEQKFNPSVVENFAELAEIARDEEDYWQNEISGWLGTVVQWSEPDWLRKIPGLQTQHSAARPLVQIGAPESKADPEVLARIESSPALLKNASLSRPWLLTETKAVQRRVLKAIGDHAGIPLEFRHIEEILRFASEDGPTGKELSLPLGWKIVRDPEMIIFLTPDLRRNDPIPDYEYTLPVPGRVVVPEVGGVIEALLVAPDDPAAEYNPQQLLQAELLQQPLIVRNWRPGDRFWPAHTKAPKKVKELLQQRHLDRPERRLWPVVLSGDEIAWMRGFPVPARLQAKKGQQGVLIQEVSSGSEDSF